MVLRSLGNFFELPESELRDLSTGGMITTLLVVPFRILWGFVVFMVFSWTTSRSGRAFVFALPAMVFAVLYIAVVWAVGFKGDLKAFGLTAARYAKASDLNGDYYNPDAALLYAKKMVETDPELSNLSKFELGNSYDRLEMYDEAFNVMASIAPDADLDTPAKELGLSQAYYWLASYYADTDKSGLTEEESKLKSRKQLELAYKANSENVFAVLGLAGMSKEDADQLKQAAEQLREDGKGEEADTVSAQAEKKLDEAVELLDEAINLDLISDRQLYASNVLIDIMQERGQTREAEVKGKYFIDKYIFYAQRFPDVLPFWISIVKVCIQIGDYERGTEYLLRGHQLAQDEEARNTLLKLSAQLEIEKAKSFEDMDNESDFLGKLYALCDAIKTDFQVPDGYTEVLYFVDGFPADDDKDFWLRDALLSAADQDRNRDPRLPGVIHILLGLRDMLNDQEQAGIRHWEIANQQFRYSPFVINNLIQVYVDERGADETQRNRLLEIAIKLFPQDPKFYATRGRFNRDDEKYEEAIEDLEFAKSRLPESIALLENLKFCHEELGNSEEAEKLQEKIDEIESRVEDDSIFPAFNGTLRTNSPKDDK